VFVSSLNALLWEPKLFPGSQQCNSSVGFKETSRLARLERMFLGTRFLHRFAGSREIVPDLSFVEGESHKI
jgi:hypothetical protein